ncbi:MAG: prolyl oligopeptidase family serine peptidase [Actinomycetota bacterium]|nr:prolyl oligopeptidase family serine peptidase [Actinomycetota bacterium]
MTESFPRQQARTQRFGLGSPRTFGVSAEGDRVVFLRSPAGDDPLTSLWVLDVGSGTERLALDAARLPSTADTAEERARRERVRERAAGVVAYSLDRSARRAVAVVGGQAWLAELDRGTAVALDLPTGAVFDARIDPEGQRIAWCSRGELWVAEIGDGGASGLAEPRRLAGEDDPLVRWGQAELVAAEEMGRPEGYWWAPDGSGVLAARVDDNPVGIAWIADPTRPGSPPRAHRYPFAGGADAEVTLWWLGLDGRRQEIAWDQERFGYLPVVTWPAGGDGRPLMVVESRDHREAQVLAAIPEQGTTEVVADWSDPAWLSWPRGLPQRITDGRLLLFECSEDTRRLTLDGEPITPPGLQVRSVVHAAETVVFTASSEPTTIECWRWSREGLEALDRGGVVVGAAGGGPTTVIARRCMQRCGVDAVVRSGSAEVAITDLSAVPVVEPGVRILSLGPTSLRVGLVLPSDHRPGTRLPVLLHPYGGPGAQRVLADRHAWLEDQWWADQGFAVVVADGRGTPGRGPAWEREVAGDVAGPVLDDQVSALHELAAGEADLDLGRVGIMGWSFGGYLAALAVLRRPEVFHAAVAGAPVTDWRLYDTYYTERLLGRPDLDPDAYERTSLLPLAAGLARPLMIVHGLADDNVLVAHSLQLSERLTEAGRPHQFLPLAGTTHMMPSAPEVAENLLVLQLRFLADALGAAPGNAARP